MWHINMILSKIFWLLGMQDGKTTYYQSFGHVINLYSAIQKFRTYNSQFFCGPLGAGVIFPTHSTIVGRAVVVLHYQK